MIRFLFRAAVVAIVMILTLFAVATAALAVGGGGISSLRGSDVAAVGLSFTSLDSASSAFLPLAETRWTV